MSQTESIFNPADESLKERVGAYYNVCMAYHLSHASLTGLNSFEIDGYLGDASEIASAENTVSSSMGLAKKSVSSNELEKAVKEQLLTREQLLEIIHASRIHDIEAQRQSENKNDQSTNKFRR